MRSIVEFAMRCSSIDPPVGPLVVVFGVVVCVWYGLVWSGMGVWSARDAAQ